MTKPRELSADGEELLLRLADLLETRDGGVATEELAASLNWTTDRVLLGMVELREFGYVAGGPKAPS